MVALSIRHRLWISFGALVALLVVVGLITLASLKANERKLVELVNDVQPTVVKSLRLIDELDRASASLGFYLLSKEPAHRDDYLKYVDIINRDIAALRASPVIEGNPQLSERISAVEARIKELAGFRDHMMDLATSPAKNIPAIAFASKEVNPRAQQMMQLLQEITLAELDQPATEERKKLLLDVSNLRIQLLLAVNELRLYLAFRSEDQLTNYASFRDNVAAGVEALKQYPEDFLTMEQYFAIDSFVQLNREYFDAADKLLAIHKADDWRQDAYIIRTEIAPLLAGVQDSLNAVIEEQNASSVADSQALTADVNRTSMVVGGLMLLGMLSALVVAVLLSRSITRPILKLRESAAHLAKGELEHEIDTSRSDELGSLAHSFAEMRDSIRRKIEDLRVLNATGEGLAGMQSQIKALQTALKVMRDQTNVEWGSVYLLDEESNRLELKAFFPEREGESHDRSTAKSFAIGEGVLGMAAQQGEVIYIPDTSHDERFVGAKEPKAVMCVPMFDEDRIFGVMNFSGVVGDVRFGTSDAEFAETIARMTVVTYKNIQLLNVIEEQNRTLEHKVQERTAELAQKTNDINNMLQNMHQGIFTIQAGNSVHPEYSAYLEKILERSDLAGMDALEMLFKDSDLGANALDQVKAALSAAVGEDAMMFDCNRHLMVGEFRKTMADGRVKILELDWDPIVDLNDQVDKVMVTVRDVTELRGLQAEAEQQKWELEVIGQILATPAEKFESFVGNARQLLEENAKLLDEQPIDSAEALSGLFRNMHTIKGNARTYGLDHVTEVAHAAENSYDRLRKGNAGDIGTERLRSELADVRGMIDTYDRIYTDKLGGAGHGAGVFIDQDLLQRARRALEGVDFNDVTSLRQAVEMMRKVHDAIGTESVRSLLEGITHSIPEMARQLGKEAPEVIVRDADIRLSADVSSVLKNVFTHGLRNSVDHGLEPTEERKALGKPDRGKITIETEQQSGKVVFRLFDDGRGLALDKIRQRAVERGLCAPRERLTDKRLAELVFESGMSTADEVTDISGRGVGMDAIKRFLQKLGGDIELRFTGKRNGSGTRPFESRITLPESVAVKLG